MASSSKQPPAPDEYPGLTIIARQALERAKEGNSPELGFTLFVFHLGENGGMAYVSTAERKSMISAIVEWLRHQANISSGHRVDVLAAFHKWFGPGAGK